MTWPFGDLQPLSYDLIMADCPWSFELYSEKGQAKSAQAKYACMSVEDIAALPVGHLAKKDAVLFMWATFPMLTDALLVMRSWGFRYCTGGAWQKRTVNGKPAFGTGYRLRSSVEPWLIGVVGRPITSRSHRNMIDGLARQHSRKPDEAYRWCESYMPHARRADLFAREKREGWEAWGNEVGKFNMEAA